MKYRFPVDVDRDENSIYKVVNERNDKKDVEEFPSDEDVDKVSNNN